MERVLGKDLRQSSRRPQTSGPKLMSTPDTSGRLEDKECDLVAPVPLGAMSQQHTANRVTNRVSFSNDLLTVAVGVESYVGEDPGSIPGPSPVTPTESPSRCHG